MLLGVDGREIESLQTLIERGNYSSLCRLSEVHREEWIAVRDRGIDNSKGRERDRENEHDNEIATPLPIQRDSPPNSLPISMAMSVSSSTAMHWNASTPVPYSVPHQSPSDSTINMFADHSHATDASDETTQCVAYSSSDMHMQTLSHTDTPIAASLSMRIPPLPLSLSLPFEIQIMNDIERATDSKTHLLEKRETERDQSELLDTLFSVLQTPPALAPGPSNSTQELFLNTLMRPSHAEETESARHDEGLTRSLKHSQSAIALADLLGSPIPRRGSLLELNAESALLDSPLLSEDDKESDRYRERDKDKVSAQVRTSPAIGQYLYFCLSPLDYFLSLGHWIVSFYKQTERELLENERELERKRNDSARKKRISRLRQELEQQRMLIEVCLWY
jgi:hypothetical protein